MINKFYTKTKGFNLILNYNENIQKIRDKLASIVSASPTTGACETTFCKPPKICYKHGNKLKSKSSDTLHVLSAL